MIVAENSISPQAADTLENTRSQDSSIGNSDGQFAVPVDNSTSGSLSTPAVRNLAKQYGVDIHEIKGTGKDGRVTKEDVLSYAATKGTIKEDVVSLSASEELSQGEKIYPKLPAAHVEQYEDKTIQLRYVVNTEEALECLNLLYVRFMSVFI